MDASIAVMAGTEVDTAMGAAYLRKNGIEALSCPVSKTAGEQMAFQVLPEAQRLAVMEARFAQLKQAGVRAVFVYCNSLSSVVDFPALGQKFDLVTATPLECYRQVAAAHSRVAVLAANAQSLAGIERELYRGNAQVDIFSAAMLPLVQAIESALPPEELIRRFSLDRLLLTFAHCGAECLILGCTHFPYLKDALNRLACLPLYDPADAMLTRLREALA